MRTILSIIGTIIVLALIGSVVYYCVKHDKQMNQTNTELVIDESEKQDEDTNDETQNYYSI